MPQRRKGQIALQKPVASRGGPTENRCAPKRTSTMVTRRGASPPMNLQGRTALRQEAGAAHHLKTLNNLRGTIPSLRPALRIIDTSPDPGNSNYHYEDYTYYSLPSRIAFA